VQEALAAGVPAIVSASAGAAERYAPFSQELGNLLLPEPLAAESLADRLRGWRANSTRFAEAISPLTGILRSHTWDHMAESMCEAMELE
jgi:hypothetical protein